MSISNLGYPRQAPPISFTVVIMDSTQFLLNKDVET